MSGAQAMSESLTMLLRTLRLPSFVDRYEDLAVTGARQGWSFGHLHIGRQTRNRVIDEARRLIDPVAISPDPGRIN